MIGFGKFVTNPVRPGNIDFVVHHCRDVGFSALAGLEVYNTMSLGVVRSARLKVHGRLANILAHSMAMRERAPEMCQRCDRS